MSFSLRGLNHTTRDTFLGGKVTPTRELARSGFWKRALAYWIDSMIVGIPAAGLAYLITWLAIDDSDNTELAIFIAGFEWWAAYLLFGILYWPLMEASRKQATFGKLALGLRVTDMQGQRLTVGRAFARHLASAINQFTGGIGYLLAACAPQRQTLHDRIAHTLVIDNRKAVTEVADGGPKRRMTSASRAAKNADSKSPRGLGLALGVFGAVGLLGASFAGGYFFFRSHDNPPTSAVSAANRAPEPARRAAMPNATPTAPLTAAPAKPAVDRTSATAAPSVEAPSSPFNPLFVPAGRIGVGRCHMGVCTWGKWLSVRRLSGDKDLVLEATLLGGSSDHENASDYPSTAAGVVITWNTAPHKITVTCSYTHPSVSNGKQATDLPLNPATAVPGVLESDAEIYFQACHSDFDGYPGAIERYGYHVGGPDGDVATEPFVEKPQGATRGMGTLGEASRICIGKPTFEFADPDDPSPRGTKVACTAVGGFRLSLLTENNTPQSHDSDPVRYYALTALTETVRSVPMFDSAFHFNRTKLADVLPYFGDRVVESHQTLGNNQAFDSAWKVKVGDEFAYFRFRDGLLRNFALADFDIDTAD